MLPIVLTTLSLTTDVISMDTSTSNEPMYPIASIKDTNDTDATNAFMDFLQTKEAKDVFVEYGFTIHE